VVATLFNPDLSYRQTEASDFLEDPEIKELLYGGAKGGGKSHLGCAWVFLESLDIIEQFGLKPSKKPPVIGWMGRKQGVDFNDTTLETWKTIIPEDQYVIRTQDKEIIIRGTVKLAFGGLDAGKDVNKFNSAQFMFFFLDQAEEATEDDIGELRAALRMTIDDTPPRHGFTALFTANPRACWLVTTFVDKCAANRRFVPALPSDNPHLPPGYEDTLRTAFAHRPELIEAYLHGNWKVFEADNAIIRRQWIREAALRSRKAPYPRKLVVCDVARFGDDVTIIMDMEETEITRVEEYGFKPTTYTAARLFIRQKALGGCLVVVDDTGVGGGVTDQLREMGVQVFAFNGAEAAVDAEHYYNRRAEAWWLAGQGFAMGDICQHYEDEELVQDLTAPTYDYRVGRILVEPKDKIKERLGRSPNKGDAYVMGAYALPQAWSPEKRAMDKTARRRWRRDKADRRVELDPMAM